MKVQVRFFAQLREQLGLDDLTLELSAPVNVADVWEQATAGAERPANVLAAINMEYVDAEAVVADGDEVAFFPPVTGG